MSAKKVQKGRVSGNGEGKVTRESDAWLLLAERYAASSGTRGLCSTLRGLADIAQSTRWDMDTRLLRHRAVHHPRGDYHGNFLYEGGGCFPEPANREARVLACLWLSHEARSEGR